jgi:transposase
VGAGGDRDHRTMKEVYMSEAHPTLGLDIAKAKIDACLMAGDQVTYTQVANTPDGFAALRAWLATQGVRQVQVCLEATGTYGEAVAADLHAAAHRVSLINPARLKAYAQVTMTRTKTDRTDARLLADFCRTQHPPQWTPPEPVFQALQALVRRLESLQAMRQQEVNRLKSGAVLPLVQASLERMLAVLDAEIAQVEAQIKDHQDHHPDLKQQHALLDSIKGIGDITATGLLAEIQDWHAYPSARDLTAQAGLTPKQKLSGTSVHGKPRLSKMGSARLRKILYFPAVVALRWNPVIHALGERLKARGKPKMVILAAAMRKLLVLVYGVLKSGRPFDPEYCRPAQKPAMGA